jgi:hypothetical protein
MLDGGLRYIKLCEVCMKKSTKIAEQKHITKRFRYA